MQLVDTKTRTGRIQISVSFILFIISIIIGIVVNSAMYGIGVGGFIITMIIVNTPLIGFWFYRWISQGKSSDKA